MMAMFLNASDSSLNQSVKIISAEFLYCETTSLPFVINNNLGEDTLRLHKYPASLQIFTY